MAKLYMPIEVNVDMETVIERLKKDGWRPVVRCKDCRWSVPATNAKGQDGCKCRLERYPVGEMYWWLEPDWFCADGERKEDDGTR